MVDRETYVAVVQSAVINGICVIYLNELIHLQELNLEQNLKMNSAIEEKEDELKLLHERTGYVNCSTLVEACRCHLVDGVSLPPKYFNKRPKIVREKCHICSGIKLTRKLFRKKKRSGALNTLESWCTRI